MADTTDAAEQEVIELGDLDPAEWNDYAEAQGWSDGLPLVMPTESAVERFVAAADGLGNRKVSAEEIKRLLAARVKGK